MQTDALFRSYANHFVCKSKDRRNED